MTATKASCLCGEIQFEWSGEKANGVWCSCQNCWKASGGVRLRHVRSLIEQSFNLYDDEAKLKLTKGEPKTMVGTVKRPWQDLRKGKLMLLNALIAQAGLLEDKSQLKVAQRAFDDNAPPHFSPPPVSK